MGVLPALNGMHVKDYVKSVFFAEIHDLPEKTEALFSVNKWSVIGLKMPVVQCQTHHSSARGSNKCQVFL